MKNRTRVVSLALVAALIAVGAVAAAVRTPVESTAASFIRDAEGNALVLHGFSTAGSAKGSPSGLPDFTIADLDRERADMGTNFVRFLISWRAVEPKPGVYSQTYLDGVEEMVGWYADRGYHVMLDMHQDLWGVDIVEGQQVGNGAPGWATYMDGFPVGHNDQWELYYLEPGVIRAFDNFWSVTGAHPELTDHYAGAWRAVAERFADNPTVIGYDLMNEPYGGTMQGPIFESGPLTALYQKTVNAIREVDDNSWACLEPQALGFNWGLPSGLGFVSDPREGEPRIAFCPHIYPLPMDLGDGFAGDSRSLIVSTVEGWRTNTLRTARELGNVPIILGEFGLDTTLPGALDYVDLMYRTAGEMGAGVAYWSRDDGEWGPYEQDKSPRNLVPALDRAYLRATSGTPGSWSSRHDLLEFTVTVREGSATAEVYLPQRGFPHGPEVASTAVGNTATSRVTITNWDADLRIATLAITGTGTHDVRISPKK